MGKLADEEESKLHWFTQIEYINHKHGSKLCDYYQPYLYMTQSNFDSFWENQKNKGYILKSYIKDDNLLIRFMDNGQVIAQAIH